jgi:hypothetical protein
MIDAPGGGACSVGAPAPVGKMLGSFDLVSAAGGLLLGGALASCALAPSQRRASPVRTAFVMQLNGDEFLPEYKKRHDGTDPHWDGPKAQLHDELSKNGVRNYSIFHLPATNQLFA